MTSRGLLVPLLLSILILLLHLWTNAFASYGYFRDELYYLACADHLDFGYVDHPPLSIFILALNRWLLGDSLFALRLLPAIVSAVVVFLTGLMARDMKGGVFAQTLASLGAVLSLVFIATGTVYSMNIFDVLFWTVVLLLLIRLINSEDRRYWKWIGIVLGLGLLNKISVLWLGFGIAAGLLLSSQRRWLRTPSPWIAGGIALLLFSPYIIWNAVHGFPHLEFIRNASTQKYGGLSAMNFVFGQFLTQNPTTAILWLGGLLALVSSPVMKAYRMFAFVYLGAFLILVVNGHSKPDYLSPIYGILFAAGGVVFERVLSRDWRRHFRPVLILVMVSGVALFPLTLPILPVRSFISYSRALGERPESVEGLQLESLPQFYADMFGWEEQAMAVVKAWQSLTPEEQKVCAIYADNYGRCGTIDLYGRKHGLPKAIGRHNSYWMWGPGGYSGEIMIIPGGDLEDKEAQFESVTVAGSSSNPYCMPYENNMRVYICRGLKTPLNLLWPSLKVFI